MPWWRSDHRTLRRAQDSITWAYRRIFPAKEAEKIPYRPCDSPVTGIQRRR